MMHLIRRRLVAGAALLALGLAGGCGGSTPVDPKAQGSPDPRIQRVGNQGEGGGAPGGDKAGQPSGGGKSSTSASSN